MEKDFDRWHARKAKLNSATHVPFFKERDVWFCYLGLNIGYEEDGSAMAFLRPVLVLKKFSGSTFFGIPLTRTPRFGRDYFTIINNKGVGFALLSQGRILDARRLHYRSEIISEDDFESLKLRFLWNMLF